MTTFYECRRYVQNGYLTIDWHFYGIRANTAIAAIAFEIAYNRISEWAWALSYRELFPIRTYDQQEEIERKVVVQHCISNAFKFRNLSVKVWEEDVRLFINITHEQDHKRIRDWLKSANDDEIEEDNEEDDLEALLELFENESETVSVSNFDEINNDYYLS
ncbi:hypothetical protein AYL99_11973 [Fonsecaea erecta]|uniref:DUF7168 domain-containing protein n=1 Tax=Fonsecaea erecta TaxID=1367422 RepID=A0A178Z327_9EURO|nr:hypothetical protein AYL99_11973 [Fonsecaea erecta]OAP53816.1 hypothetical protein AYL99_11973 [Fonsecaea erecta]